MRKEVLCFNQRKALGFCLLCLIFCLSLIGGKVNLALADPGLQDIGVVDAEDGSLKKKKKSSPRKTAEEIHELTERLEHQAVQIQQIQDYLTKLGAVNLVGSYQKKSEMLDVQQKPVVSGESSPIQGKTVLMEQKLYDDAYARILRRDFLGAEKAFHAFIKAHQNSRLLSKAQYWLGESYVMQEKFESALPIFKDLYRKKEDLSDQYSLIIFRLATSLGRTGNKKEACLRFYELKKGSAPLPDHVRIDALKEAADFGC